MTRARQPILRPGVAPHPGQLSSAAFVPMGVKTRTLLVLFFLMSNVISPGISATMHGTDNPYPLLTFGLDFLHTGLLLAPLALPMRIGLLHPLVFPLLFDGLRAFIKDPYYLLSPIGFLFEKYQLMAPHAALAHYGAEQLAVVAIKVLILNIVGLLAYYAGYAWFRTRVKRREPRRYLNVAAPLFGVALLTMVGAIAFISWRGGFQQHMTSLAFGRFNALGSVGHIVALFDLAALALFLWFSHRPGAIRAPLYLAMLFPVALLPFIISGSRGAMFIFAVELGILWVMQRRRLPVGAIVAILLMVPTGVVVLGALGSVRNSAWGDGQADFSAVTAFDLQTSMENGQEEIRRRRMVDGETGVIAEGPHITGHLWGQTYVGAALFWIPRAVWPDKPRSAGAHYVNTILSPGASFGVPVGPVAEAYWNFSYAGVLIVMLLWGGFHRWLGDYYAVNGDNPFFRVFYLITITTATPSSDFFAEYMQQVMLLVVLFMVLRLLSPVAAVRRPPQWRPMPGPAYRVPTPGRFGPR